MRIEVDFLFFDWNGTLLNDREHNFDIVNILRVESELPPLTMEKYLTEFCFPLENFYRNIGFDLKKVSFQKLSERFVEEYHKKPLFLFEESREILHKMKHKIPMGILSAYKQDRLNELLKDFDLNMLFECILGIEDDLARSKSHLLKNFRHQNPQYQKILIVGDTAHDFEVARENNAQCHLISAGHQSKESLQNQCPEALVFNTLREWSEFLIGF